MNYYNEIKEKLIKSEIYDNDYVIKYCSDDRIIAREYELS
jgi:hypothetical protein